MDGRRRVLKGRGAVEDESDAAKNWEARGSAAPGTWRDEKTERITKRA